jgi:chitinase
VDKNSLNFKLYHINLDMSLSVSLQSTQNWGTGGNGIIIITNNGTQSVTNWKIQLTTEYFIIQSVWELGMTTNSGPNDINITAPSWNTSLAIAPNNSITSGFSYSCTTTLTNLNATSSTAGVTITSNVVGPPSGNTTNPAPLDFSVSLASTSNWATGGNGTITITNNGTPQTNWQFSLTTQNFTIQSFWQLSLGILNNNANTIMVGPASWNPTINAGQTITSGFSYTCTSNLANLYATTTTTGVTLSSSNIEPGSGSNSGSGTNSGSGSNSGPTTITIPTGINQHVPGTPKLASSKKVFAYFTEWSIYGLGYSVNMIPVSQLTHILYAFTLPQPSQADYNLLCANYAYPPKPYNASVPEATMIFQDPYASSINIANLIQLKANNPQLKILFSIGGWSFSWIFSTIAANPSLTQVLASSAVSFIIKNGFDGIDFDWEFPGVQGIGYNYVDPVNDGPNFGKLLQAVRQEMDQQSPNYHLELTCAMGTNPVVINNLASTEPYLDYALLMCYDYFGPWGNGGHLSALYDHTGLTLNSQFNGNSAVLNFEAIKFPLSKIVMGCPMYARGWAKIVPTNPAIPIFGQSISGPANSYSGVNGEPGLTFWKDLVGIVGTNGLTRYFDNVALVPYLHNSVTGETWTYEDDISIQYKAQYVVQNNLAGMMFWELSNDTRSGNNNILSSAVSILNALAP